MSIVLMLAMVFVAAISFFARLWKATSTKAWLIGFAVMPAVILFDEFVLPYRGGGASMWPIAVFFAGVYGGIASSIGVYLAERVIRRRAKNA